MPKPNILHPNKTLKTAPSGEKGVARIGVLLSRQADTLERSVWELYRAVKRHGREVIEDELGPDAGELMLLFDGIKAAAELLGVEDLPDLPA